MVLDFQKRKGVLYGSVTIDGLPEIKMYSVSVSLFSAENEQSPLPYGGVPPSDKYTDTVYIKEADESLDKAIRFELDRKAGFYHLDVGVIAYIENGGKLYAQVEHFFPLECPVKVEPGVKVEINLRPVWPDTPFEDLGYYGTVSPNDDKG